MSSLERYSNKNNKNIDIYEKIIVIWKNIPLFIKLFLITTFIFYIMNLLTKNISFFLSNIPYYTISYFQIWRLITTIFISTHLFKIILGLICWVKYASSLESSIGTVKYMTIFFLNTLFIQIIYCILKYSIKYLFKKDNNYLIYKNSLRGINNNSLWGNIICELTLLCISNPESPNKLLLIPVVIKAKYYPFLLLGIFTIANSFIIDLEVLSGLLYAYIYFYYLKNILKISDDFAQKLEDNIIFNNLTNFNSFVSISNVNNGNTFSVMNVSVNQIRMENDMEYINNKNDEEYKNLK